MCLYLRLYLCLYILYIYFIYILYIYIYFYVTPAEAALNSGNEDCVQSETKRQGRILCLDTVFSTNTAVSQTPLVDGCGTAYFSKMGQKLVDLATKQRGLSCNVIYSSELFFLQFKVLIFKVLVFKVLIFKVYATTFFSALEFSCCFMGVGKPKK